MKIFCIIPILCLVCHGCVNIATPNNGQARGQQTAADYTLAANVKVAIVSDPSISATSRLVTVGANNGVITLSGQVANQADADTIVNIAKNVAGVKSVNNQMTVAGN